MRIGSGIVIKMHVPRLPSRPSETESLRVGPRYLNVGGKPKFPMSLISIMVPVPLA